MANSIVRRIEELHSSIPFQRFSLILDDGSKVLIDRPEFLGVFPKKDKVFYSAVDDTTAVVDVARIERVESGSSSTRRRRAS